MNLHAHSGNSARILYSVVSSSESILENIEADSKLVGDLPQIIDFYQESSFAEKAARMTFYPASAAEAIECIGKKVRVVYNNEEYDARRASYLNIEMMKLAITEDSEEALETAKKVMMRSLDNFPVTRVADAAKCVAMATKFVSFEQALSFGDWFMSKIEDRVLSRKTIKPSKSIASFKQSEMSVEMMFAHHGMIVDASATGTGKTNRNIELAKNAIANGKKVGIICHRVSIATSIHAKIPDAFHYQNAKNPGDLADASCLVVVINSINYSNFFQFLSNCNLIILEEGKQLLDHAAIGTCENRIAVFNKLNSVIKTAKTVVVTDADSSNQTLSYLKNARKDLTLLSGEADFSDINFEISSHDETIFKLYEAAKDGKKFLLSCDSVKTVNGIQHKLTQELGLKVLAITSENSLDEAQKAFTLTPNSECEHYDAVLYSPVITSTLSLTNLKFFTHFGLFSGVIDASTAIQMLRRNRTCKQFFVGVMKNKEVKAEEISVSANASAHELFAAEVEVASNYEKNHIGAAIYYTAIHQGFNVSVTSSAEKTGFGNAIFKQARKVENEVFEETMLQTTADSAAKSEQESHQEVSDSAQRARIERTLGKRDLTLEDIKNYKRGSLSIHLKNIEVLQTSKADCQMTDAREETKMVRDRQNLTLKHIYFNQIFATLGLKTSDFSGSFTVGNSNELMTNLRSNAKEFNRTGLYAVRALKDGEVLRAQTKSVAALLREFGFEIVEEKQGTDGKRSYLISEASKKVILDCVARGKLFDAK